MQSRFFIAVLAAVALCTSAGANAFSSTPVPAGAPPAAVPALHAQALHAPSAQPVHMPVQAYGPQGAYDGRGWDGRPGASACWAPRWEPDVRYMPGQVVRRHGELWIARRISARVWNENSPPEWTPQYWVPAVCG